MLDNVVGEWEKEGFGRGLEERLDVLVIQPAVDSPVVSPVWFLGFRGRLLHDVSKRGEWNSIQLYSSSFPFFCFLPYLHTQLFTFILMQNLNVLNSCLDVSLSPLCY
jgi:hypothetical protein